MARATSGEIRATTSSAAANAILSGDDPAAGAPDGDALPCDSMGTSSGLSLGAQARGRGTSSLPGGRFHLAHASRDARDNTAAARGGGLPPPPPRGRRGGPPPPRGPGRPYRAHPPPAGP